jgi:serine/threonine protein kinase
MNCVTCNADNPTGTVSCRVCGSPLASDEADVALRALQPGAKLYSGKYSVGKVLGYGGFGITYRGADSTLRRQVAIKEFFPPDHATRSGTTVRPKASFTVSQFEADKAKFLDEARTLAQFRHPGIVQVYESFEENNTAYFVMELLNGRSLIQILHDDGVFEENRALSILRAVGEALDVIHKASLIHRDLKPDNILLTDDGRPVLIDFGTAREFTEGKTRRMTQMLTPGYAPLEQYGSAMRFSPSTDIYALCATAYHLVTGELPVAPADRLGGVELKSPHLKNAKLSRRFSDALMWGLAVKATERPQSIGELLQAFDKGVAGPSKDTDHASKGGDDDSGPYLERVHVAMATLKEFESRAPHVSRLRPEIEKIIQALSDYACFQITDVDHCPSCRKQKLAKLDGAFDGTCVVCRKAKLLKRTFKPGRCAICRKDGLQTLEMSATQTLCPVCRRRPLFEQKRKRLGLALDLWWVCDCGAEFDVLFNSDVRLESFKSDPGGRATKLKGKAVSQAQWFKLTERSDSQNICPHCAAKWYLLDGDRALLASAKTDPYGVAKQYGPKPLPMTEWNKLGYGHSSEIGNTYCGECRSEFEYARPERTLTLLSVNREAHPWIVDWINRPVPLAQWCLMRDGKQSLHEGWLCAGCQTEFDLASEPESSRGWLAGAISSALGQGGSPVTARKLIRTGSHALHSMIGQAMQPEDWQRVGANVPTEAMAAELRSRLSDLEKRERQELDEVERNRKTEIQHHCHEIEKAVKEAALMGGVSQFPSDGRVRLESDEHLRIECRCFKLKLRTRDSIPYWDVDTQGQLVVTNQRVLFLSAMEINEWPYSKITSMDMDFVGNDPIVLFWLDRLKKPIGLHPLDSTLSVHMEGRHRHFDVTFDDVLKVLQQEIS